MENEYFNQRIACSVSSCKYYDGDESRCTLGKISIKGNQKKENTFCDSFQKAEDE